MTGRPQDRQHRGMTSPTKPTDASLLTAAQFLKETAHLGLEAQARVLRTIVEANRQRKARLEAAEAIHNAKKRREP